MKLKNQTILDLVNNGLLNTTEHDVPAADAYKAYKFRKAIEKACNAIVEKDRDLPKAAGIEDGKESTEEQKARVAELRAALYNDETELDGNIVPMSWESFHALSNENRKVAVQITTGEMGADGSPKIATVYVDVFRVCETLLEGVLFKAED